MGVRSRPTTSEDPVRERILGLPRRLRPDACDGLAAAWDLHLGPHAFSISIAERNCVVREGASGHGATVISADPETWLAIDEGRLLGARAYLEGLLDVRGNLDLAIRLQTLFRPYRRKRQGSDLEQVEIDAGGIRVSCYLAGGGEREPMLLLHGLGASKVTWLPVLSALAADRRVVVPDLPGHGESGKPRAGYSPRFHANAVRRLMDELALERVVAVGNSLGGRIALEVAAAERNRVSALVLLDPSVPGVRWRHILGLARIVPSEIAALPFPLRERWVGLMIRRLFADPRRLGERAYSLAAGEFIRIHRDSRARMAFLASLRHVVTERPAAFFRRLERIRQPTLVVFGDSDRLVPVRLGVRLAQQLPDARLVVLPGVGHVPQFEATEATLAVIRDFLDSIRV